MHIKRIYGYFLVGFSVFFCLNASALLVDVAKAKPLINQWGKLYLSQIAPNLQSSLNYHVGGEVSQVMVDDGSRVKKGQAMAKLDTEELKLKLLEAQANLKSAKKKYEYDKQVYLSHKKLLAKSYVSPLDLQKIQNDSVSSRNSYLKAKVMEKVAQRDLRKSILLAPYDLVVEKRLINPGQVISANHASFDVFKLSPLEVRIVIPEASINAVKVGDSADVFVKTLQTHFKGTVRSVGAKPVYASSYSVDVSLLDPSSSLKPGMQVAVRLALKNKQSLVTVPLEALVGNQSKNDSKVGSSKLLGRSAVYLYNSKTKKVKLTPVVVSQIHLQTAWLTEGISPGQLVVVTGTNQLRDDVQVVINK